MSGGTLFRKPFIQCHLFPAYDMKGNSKSLPNLPQIKPVPPLRLRESPKNQTKRSALSKMINSIAPAPASNSGKVLEHLEGIEDDERRQAIGEILYENIQSRFPETACKLVGMMLELDDDEQLKLVSDSKKLEDTIAEALEILKVGESKMQQSPLKESYASLPTSTSPETPTAKTNRGQLNLDFTPTPTQHKKSYAEAASGSKKTLQTPDYVDLKQEYDLAPKKLFDLEKSNSSPVVSSNRRKNSRGMDSPFDSAMQLEDLKGSRDPHVLANRLVKILNEPKAALISLVVKEIGITTSLQICKETADCLRNGGMKRKDGKGNRSTGGTFLTILKKYVSAEDYKRFYKVAGRRMTPRNTPRQRKRIRRTGFQ